MSAPGLVIAAVSSGSGKTVATLGLLTALKRRGYAVASFKTGPDYIDPAFHARVTGRPCFNLDSWAMRLEVLAGLFEETARGADLVIGEGVMGLFDGAPDGRGSTADLAMVLGLPVILVVEAQRLGQSAAAIVEGFVRFREDVEVAGVLFNRVGGAAHFELLRAAVEERSSIPVLGFLPRDPALELPERHLGLVQAGELQGRLAIAAERAADLAQVHVDLERLVRLARPPRLAAFAPPPPQIPPPGQHVAVARDEAFGFVYESVLLGWRRAGAHLSFFSPLSDEAPGITADAVVLPGGYPELHAGRIAHARRFLDGIRRAAARGAFVYGECGGYMVLGRHLTDREGIVWLMAGLLPVSTSFARPQLHLGYREAVLAADTPLGPAGTVYAGHEFHFAREIERGGAPLFSTVRDARGRELGPAGVQVGRVAGSFLHLVDRRPSPSGHGRHRRDPAEAGEKHAPGG